MSPVSLDVMSGSGMNSMVVKVSSGNNVTVGMSFIVLELNPNISLIHTISNVCKGSLPDRSRPQLSVVLFRPSVQ